jgi:hypothetical protein
MMPALQRTRQRMRALVLNAIGGRFDFEDVDIAAPIGREVLVEVRASGLCHTDLLFATHHDFVPTPACTLAGGQALAGMGGAGRHAFRAHRSLVSRSVDRRDSSCGGWPPRKPMSIGPAMLS